MTNITLIKLKNLLDEKKYAEAFVMALEVTDNLSNIKDTSSANNNVKYKNWIESYVIDLYDILITKHQELNDFKINHHSISKNSLQNIAFNYQDTNSTITKNLKDIIYSARCSIIHSRVKVLMNFPKQGLNTKFEEMIDEDNVFYISNNEIVICPKYFATLLFLAINNYIDQILQNPQSDEYNRYVEYIEENSDIIKVTLQPEAIRFRNEIDMDIVVLAYINAEKKIILNEDFFEFERPNNVLVKVSYDDIKSFEKIIDKGVTNVIFKHEVLSFGGICVVNDNSAVTDLIERLNVKSN